jgi:peptidoglycan hydrolase-like protein with peptidoglycan-binding domain
MTMRRDSLEQESLRNRVSDLERQLQEREQEVAGLKEELNRYVQEEGGANVKFPGGKSVTSKPTTKQIQIALKNAGYDPGPVDGKKGQKTREAIMAFQKANGLAVDGRVGKLTWGLLRDYLQAKAK